MLWSSKEQIKELGYKELVDYRLENCPYCKSSAHLGVESKPDEFFGGAFCVRCYKCGICGVVTDNSDESVTI